MKVLFAVSNDKMSETIIKQYQKDYKQVISYKNVYYFNAILKELQKDKTYDRIVISEDLEQYTNNNDFEKNDNFIFSILDNISDEAYNQNGEDVPIILICNERRNKSEAILVKLFGIGIYNAIIGDDRSVNEVCKLLNRPRSKKEAKMYYKIDSDDVTYEPEDENSVNEIEIQNILAHYKRLGDNEEKYVESFESIASQYNNQQLKVICKCLPLNVRAVLEEKSPKYQQINSYNNKIADHVRLKKNEMKKGPSEIFLKNGINQTMNEPVVIPSAIDTTKIKKIDTKTEKESEINEDMLFEDLINNAESNTQEIQGIDEIFSEKESDETKTLQALDTNELITNTNSIENTKQENVEIVKRGRGRPKKIKTEPEIQIPKRGRGRPRKNVETIIKDEEINEIENGDSETTILPGLNDMVKKDEAGEEENILPGFEKETNDFLPGLENNKNNLHFEENIKETQYSNVLTDLKNKNETDFLDKEQKEERETYPELNIEELLINHQKIVSFIGTSKNGTSFLINNVAELLSTNGINVAILDLTKNRNAYFIYTKNEDSLREKSNYTINNLSIGKADGIEVHRNLTVYTSPIENDENLQDVEPIIETLLKNHTLVLLDCDFTTPMKYFKYSQEIYLVQSMDILTIQPLTAFIRQLKDKNMFDENKVRVILNKFIKTKEINEQILIGGISIYNDPSMTVRKELFDRKTVKYVTIPFELKTYLRYLDGLVVCDVTLNGYTKEFMQSLKQLANMIYTTDKNSAKYMPPSVKKNSGFTSNINDTLDKMKKSY